MVSCTVDLTCLKGEIDEHMVGTDRAWGLAGVVLKTRIVDDFFKSWAGVPPQLIKHQGSLGSGGDVVRVLSQGRLKFRNCVFVTIELEKELMSNFPTCIEVRERGGLEPREVVAGESLDKCHIRSERIRSVKHQLP